ncbi:hypothetical protein [Frankia sp. Cj3]|uniref:hypothetical protein n=1 Tax=Frankia sp. Cj3 TaxID=2880976 RepID=UPI001EF70BB3|nr:hypothetical protein [Frankia sp. Cj3]
MDTTLDLLVAKMDRARGGKPAAWLKHGSPSGVGWTTRITGREAASLAAELEAVDRGDYTVAAGAGGGSIATYETDAGGNGPDRLLVRPHSAGRPRAARGRGCCAPAGGPTPGREG